MIDPDDRPETIPLFPADYRGSGLLLHVNSLPSPYGIGDVGPAAFDWVDRLQATGPAAGGRRCRWDRREMAVRLPSPCRRLPETRC